MFKKNLLKWAQRMLDPYANIQCKNFHKDWANGLNFCALVHAFDPSVIDYDSLTEKDIPGNLKLSFDTAESAFGIAQLLDVEDITDFSRPDDIIVMTYLSCFYKYYRGHKDEIEENQYKKVSKKKKVPPRPKKKPQRPKRPPRPKKLSDEVRAEIFKMRGTINKKNKSREEKAKANWSFLKSKVDAAVKKIEINLEEIAELLWEEQYE